MRISDWSSDVCSSDLVEAEGLAPEGLPPRPSQKEAAVGGVHRLAEPRHDAVERVSPAGQRARRREERGEGAAGLGGIRRHFPAGIAEHVGKATVLDEEAVRSEENTSELQSLMRISYAVFCFKKTSYIKTQTTKLSYI